MKRFLPTALLAVLPALARADEMIAPIGVSGVVFGFTAIIVGIVAYGRYRSQRLRHETIRMALEKGQLLPPDLLDRAASSRYARNSPERDLRRGLVLLAVGLGSSLCLRFSETFGQESSWAVGFIPGLIGVAYLVAYALGRGGSTPKPER